MGLSIFLRFPLVPFQFYILNCPPSEDSPTLFRLILPEELRANSLTGQAHPISCDHPQLPKGAEYHTNHYRKGGAQ